MLEKLSTILSDLFGEDITIIKNVSHFNELNSWDSLLYVRLVITIQSKFLIALSQDDVESLTSFPKIITILESKGMEL